MQGDFSRLRSGLSEPEPKKNMVHSILGHLDAQETRARQAGDWELVAWYFNGTRTIHLAQLDLV